MRSRYSAYATEAADYIYQTYAQASRALQSIADISAWAKETKWLKLTINAASDYTELNAVNADNKGQHLPTVCFSAYYQYQGEYFLVKETSRFVVEKGQWRYLDGEVSNNEALIAPKRNQACFCDSDKKFKQCCGR
jgi:SEC-C motif-containing protein